jgi:tetraacyldisaccharide 4'-kinase
MDVVVVTAEDLDDALLPAGNLREGLRALRRADALVVREEERGSVLPRLEGMMRADAAVWMVRRTVEFPGADALFHPGPGPMRTGLIAFCAIARPSNFFDSVRDAGGRLVDSIAFPDHYRYTATDMGRLIEACREWAGDGFVTTEKDAVKLTPEMRAQLDAVAPLLVARLTVAFADADAVVRAVEARIS